MRIKENFQPMLLSAIGLATRIMIWAVNWLNMPIAVPWLRIGREDLAHVEVLGGVEAGTPEEDEEVDEEDGGLVGTARVDGS